MWFILECICGLFAVETSAAAFFLILANEFQVTAANKFINYSFELVLAVWLCAWFYLVPASLLKHHQSGAFPLRDSQDF